MILEPTQLAELEQHAENMIKPSDIAIILRLDPQQFKLALRNPESEVHQAYQRGFLRTKSFINKSIITLAKHGSSPAQTMAQKLVQDVENESFE
jgi:hypothetical protein